MEETDEDDDCDGKNRVGLPPWVRVPSGALLPLPAPTKSVIVEELVGDPRELKEGALERDDDADRVGFLKVGDSKGVFECVETPKKEIEGRTEDEKYSVELPVNVELNEAGWENEMVGESDELSE